MIEKFSVFLCVALVFAGVLSGFSQTTAAQNKNAADKVTPSDVYHSTEQLRFALGSFGLLNMSAYNAVPLDTGLRHPRHVIQKVRECHSIISKLLKENGVNAEPLPDLFSFREIRPLDVKNGVDHLVREVNRLGEISPPVDRREQTVQGKLPVDVYNNLNRICHSVSVEIKPSDVYQVASVVLDNMKNIAHSRGYSYEAHISENKRHSVKIPKHVYQETWAFLKDLRELALDPDYAIPGGIIMPTLQPEGEIKPKDVMNLMNDALSETDAIKYSLGVREKTTLPKWDEGKTPTDVFDKIYKAHVIVRGLKLHEKQSYGGYEQ